MELSNLFWLAVGCALGWYFGRLDLKIDKLNNKTDRIKKELDEVEEYIVPHDEKGFMHVRVLRDVIVGILFVASCFAAIASGAAKQKSDETADKYSDLTECTVEIVGKTLTALGERTQYTTEFNDRTISLTTSQRDFFTILLHQPPYSEARQTQSVQDYYSDLGQFLDIARKTNDKVANNPIPTVQQYKSCISKGEDK